MSNERIALQYLGCSAFVLAAADGTSIGIDLWTKGAFPYAEDVPAEIGIAGSDLTRLLVSHDHKDHSFVPEGTTVIYGVKSRKVVDNPQLAAIGGANVGVFASEHFATGAKRPKANAVFKLSTVGVRLVHLGDAHGTLAEHVALETLKQKVGAIDVLLLPIGDPWLKKVDAAVLRYAVETLEPRVVVPMHYWKIAHKHDFLADLSAAGYRVVDVQGNLVTFSQGDLDTASKTVWNMTAGRYQPAREVQG